MISKYVTQSFIQTERGLFKMSACIPSYPSENVGMRRIVCVCATMDFKEQG